MADGCVKIRLIKKERRSRGRAAVRTFTLLRGVRHDAERADLLDLLASIVPMIDGAVECRFGGGVYEIERIESRRDHGRRLERARFAGERGIFRECAKRRRSVRRAEKRSRGGVLRAARREAAARILEMFRRCTEDSPAEVPPRASARAVAPAPAEPALLAPAAKARGTPAEDSANLGSPLPASA